MKIKVKVIIKITAVEEESLLNLRFFIYGFFIYKVAFFKKKSRLLLLTHTGKSIIIKLLPIFEI